MSEYSSLIVTVGNPVTDDGDHSFVKLEEGDWNPYVNYLTQAQAVGWLNTFMFGTSPPASNCSGGSATVTVYAYPSRMGLAFVLGTSSGFLTAKGVEPYENVEIRQVEFETELDSGALPGETVSAIWQGDTYWADGSTAASPPITVSGSTINLPIATYGALVITKTGFRYVYELTITPDPNLDENSMDAVVYAIWDGGVNGIEITAPDGVEGDDCNNRAGVGGGSTTIDENDDDDGDTYVEGKDHFCKVNWCTEWMPGTPVKTFVDPCAYAR